MNYPNTLSFFSFSFLFNAFFVVDRGCGLSMNSSSAAVPLLDKDKKTWCEEQQETKTAKIKIEPTHTYQEITLISVLFI